MGYYSQKLKKKIFVYISTLVCVNTQRERTAMKCNDYKLTRSAWVTPSFICSKQSQKTVDELLKPGIEPTLLRKSLPHFQWCLPLYHSVNSDNNNNLSFRLLHLQIKFWLRNLYLDGKRWNMRLCVMQTIIVSLFVIWRTLTLSEYIQVFKNILLFSTFL